MLSTPPARVVNEVALHSVQKKITEKIELITNFASIKNQIRYLVNQLNFYDRPTAPGLISYEDFLHYFVRRLNFMGLNKELEFVFFHYDEQMTGFLDYKYFAQQLYSNITPCYPILTKDSMESLEKMRVHILGRTCDTHNILRFLRQLNELPGQKDGFIPAITFAQHLSVMLDKDYSTFYWRREVTNLLECFDILHDKTNVHIPTFARYLLSPFAIYRKQLVRAIYDMLSANHPGFPTVEDVRTCYVASPQNPIEFRGKLFAPTSLNELLQFFINDNHNNHNTITDKSVSSSDHNNYHIYDHEIITWSSFLTYYESLSMIIDKEEHFEYIVRRSWSIPYAPSGEEFYLTTLNFVGSGPASVRGPPSPNATNHGFAPITIVTSGTTPRSGKGSADDYDDRSLASHSFAGDSKTSSPSSTASPTSRRSRSGARSPSKTIHRRVIVVHSDQSSEVVKIVDELGKTRLDNESVRKELVAMGIDDIQDIKL